MPAFLEAILKKEYGAKSKAPFKIMNKLGAMRGNRETPKGRKMQKQHMVKLASIGKANASGY